MHSRGKSRDKNAHTFYEFFCGGGMARAGLGEAWRCLLANDNDAVKAQSYARNWGGDHLRRQDVETLSLQDLPSSADLAWASFPCQDLSLAGPGAGLAGKRSSCFWPFWELVLQLKKDARAPRLVVLENVSAALSSHGGNDFQAIARALVDGGYRMGALVIDAAQFLPQSRPRLFIIACTDDVTVAPGLVATMPEGPYHNAQVEAAWARLPKRLKDHWLWWRLPEPALAPPALHSLLLPDDAVQWRPPAETARLLSLMNPLHREKVREAQETGERTVGAVYRRTRTENGERVQRAEVRFDGVAGCLRTPQGGSSRQVILVAEGEKLRSRLLSAREAARLMGLPDAYELPARENQGLHLAGDGVAVPVVRHLARHLLEPLLVKPQSNFAARREALALGNP